jgi:hypothetical protein
MCISFKKAFTQFEHARLIIYVEDRERWRLRTVWHIRIGIHGIPFKVAVLLGMGPGRIGWGTETPAKSGNPRDPQYSFL